MYSHPTSNDQGPGAALPCETDSIGLQAQRDPSSAASGQVFFTVSDPQAFAAYLLGRIREADWEVDTAVDASVDAIGIADRQTFVGGLLSWIRRDQEGVQ